MALGFAAAGAAEGLPGAAAGVVFGTDTIGGKLEVKCHRVIVRYNVMIIGMKTKSIPFAIRAGDVLIMLPSSREVMLIFLSCFLQCPSDVDSYVHSHNSIPFLFLIRMDL
jgi:hypothetical protein